MKKRNLLWTMAAVVALASCSDTELVEAPPQVQEQNAITFGTYVGDNAQSRAVVMDETLLGVEGFGVNAYYTGTDAFDANATYEGNAIFMENTKVTYNKDKSVWEYSPVKYWPNNEGEMVSFFAYGPYAKTGDASDNIDVEGTNLTFTVASNVKDQVDLIYNNQTDAPTIDKTKQAVNERVLFKFDHALSRIAFTVEAAVDEVDNGNNLLDGNTRINVKKVALIANGDVDPLNPSGPFYQSGTLSLLNPEFDDEGNEVSPWSNGIGSQGFVFNATDHFYHTVKDVDAENLYGEEIDVVQLTRFNASEPQRLLNDESYLMVIPQEATFKIYIEYDVISEGNDNDGNGNYDGSAITNKITSAEALTVTFEKGMAYNFNLVLGMTSVKFEVDEVAAWEDPVNEDVWVPNNTETAAFAYDSENNQIQIKTAADLAKMRDLVNSGAMYQVNETGDGVVTVTDGRASSRTGEVMEYAAASYLQVGDIDLGGMEWTPIGFRGDGEFPFKGSYNVAYNEEEYSYYKIHNLTINTTAEGLDLGLFGYVLGDTETSAYLNGIWLENPNIVGQNTVNNDRYTGGVVGYCQNATISDCHINGDEYSIISDYYAGGFVGYINADVDILHCTNHGVKIEGRFVGGICGQAVSSAFNSCFNYGQVEGRQNEDSHAGGIVGFCNGEMSIESCSNHADVKSTWTSGGIVGIFTGGSNTTAGTITASYNLGSISGDADAFVGGIAGWASAQAGFTACYNTAASISDAGSAGGIIGLAAAENITLTACYSTTTTFTDAGTYGGIVGNNVNSEVTYTPTYSACYYTLTENLTAWGYADEDGEGVSEVDSDEGSWNEPVEGMNSVLTGWEYTINPDYDADTVPAIVNIKYESDEE